MFDKFGAKPTKKDIELVYDFTREITHTGYKHGDKLKKYYHRVQKQISEKPTALRKGIDINNIRDKTSWYADQNFMNMPTAGNITPIIGGGYRYL